MKECRREREGSAGESERVQKRDRTTECRREGVKVQKTEKECRSESERMQKRERERERVQKRE